MRVLLASVLVSAVILVGVLTPAGAEDAKPRRAKIVRIDNREFQGEVLEEGDVYVITQGTITTRIPKTQVKRFIPLEEAVAEEGSAPSEGPLSDERLQAILGPDENYAIVEQFGESASNAMEPSPVNPEGVAEMQRIAGPKSEVLETAHFVFVYTSPRSTAQELAARLESVYKWNLRFMESLGIPSHRPEYKLEIYFWGTHKEFRAYAAIDVGGTGEGTLGWYMPPTNRSSFFAMEDWPPYRRALEEVNQKGIDGREKQRRKNRLDRLADHQNLEVVQHEAAHHIHFNIGLFNRRGDNMRWWGEGMATMFEAPPSQLGASLGVTNHYRLRFVRNMFYQAEMQAGRFQEGYLRYFLWRMGSGEFGFREYSLAWAVCNYIWREHREGAAKFWREAAELEDDVSVTFTERQKHWEDCFGPLDEKWERDFVKYLNELQLKTDHLPDELMP